MGLNFFKNPFFLYGTSFFIVILLYFLGWSELFPSFSIDVVLFFVFTSLFSVFIGLYINKKKPIKYFKISSKNPRHVLIGIYICYVISFIHNNGIPLLLILSKSSFFYKNYGIPFFQPIITTFTSFYTVYLFHIYLSEKNKQNLIHLILILTIPLLIYNRGMLIISLINFGVIFLLSKNKVKLKEWFHLAIVGVLALYFFGVLGNFRNKSSSNEVMLNVVGKATEQFKESLVPKEFFWSYLYITSPLANFQKTVNENPKTNNNWKGFITYEVLPDFISKRVSNFFNITKGKASKISIFLTAGTTYSDSYRYLGWLGPILIFFYLMILVSLYWFVIKKENPFYITGISILCTFTIFSIFSNTIHFSGLSLQLFYPIFYQFIIKYKLFTSFHKAYK